MRQQMAALQFLLDREIIVLDPRVMRSINLDASTRTILISASQQRHIINRRQIKPVETGWEILGRTDTTP